MTDIQRRNREKIDMEDNSGKKLTWKINAKKSQRQKRE